MSLTLKDVFFTTEMSFFQKGSFTPSDLMELEEFNVIVLNELKELALFSIFKGFKDFKSMSIYKELKGL